jgi:hypothetical protein
MKVSNLINGENTPSSIRAYIIHKNKHYFVCNGKLEDGFESKQKIEKNRDSVLSLFSKMSFLFDEIIRLRIVGFQNNESGSELLYLLNLIPINRKIRTLYDWKVFDPKFTQILSRLFDARSSIVQCVSIDDAKYVPDDSISLSTNSGFRKFSKNLGKAWKDLIEIYKIQQNMMENSKP